MNVSEFQSGYKNTLVHALDPRVKVFLVAALSSVLVKAGFWQLALVGGLILLLGWIGRVNFVKLLWGAKPFLVLLAFIFLARSFSGSGTPLLSIFGLALTVDGIVASCAVLLRIVFLVLLGFLYSATTSPKQTKAAIEWFLRPLPFNERVLGTAISIGIRFFPQVVEETKRVQEAQKVRFAEKAGILKRFKSFAPNLIIRIFERAQKVSMAMDARCYSADRPARLRLSASTHDYFAFAFVCLFVSCIHLFTLI